MGCAKRNFSLSRCPTYRTLGINELMWRFEIAHLPGVTNHAADATSRHPVPGVTNLPDSSTWRDKSSR